MKTIDLLRVVLVLIPFTAVGIYAIADGVFWSESIDVVSLTLGLVTLLCVGGMTRAWLRYNRHKGEQ
jgi:TRAP-type mannitol/chloroaromatic compound transport system permease small subunit